MRFAPGDCFREFAVLRLLGAGMSGEVYEVEHAHTRTAGYMIAAEDLPDGLTMNPNTGIVSGVVAADAVSQTPYDVTVTASSDSSWSQRFTGHLETGSASVTARDRTASIKLGRGGTVNVCQTSVLHVTENRAVSVTAPLLFSLDRGAIEIQMTGTPGWFAAAAAWRSRMTRSPTCSVSTATSPRDVAMRVPPAKQGTAVVVITILPAASRVAEACAPGSR